MHKDVVGAVLGCQPVSSRLDFFSGEEGKHEYGVGFLVHKDVVGAVLGCQPVSSRLISIRLRAAFQYHHHTGLCTNIWS